MTELGATTIVGTEAGGDSFDDLLRQAMKVEARSLPELELGCVLDGKYRIDAEIGHGGMGRVYRAHDIRLERDVAIKVHVTITVDGQQWSLREATALARLSHPNVVTVHEVGMWEGHPWVAMEYVPGGTARTWAEHRSPSEILALFLGAGRGLVAAHTAGIVHRDFKPDNILVTADGQGRVADFGLALHLAKADGNATNLVMGTPAYMAPEQWDRGAVGAAADQFSFAVSLWELLAGARPYRGHTEAEIRAAWLSPPRATKMPRRVEAALRRALAPRAADRWPAMEPLLAALAHQPKTAIGVAVGAVVLGGAALAWSASGSAPAVVDEQPCATALASFTKTEQMRAELSAVAGDPVIAKLDGWMKRWRTARLAACEDTHVKRTQPLAVLELRELCLDRARVAIEATLPELVTAKDRSPLVDALPRLEPCNDVAAMRVSSPLPSEAVARAEIASINAAISTVRVHNAAGRTEEALALVEPLLERAAATGRKALEAEVQMLLANLRLANQKPDGTKEMFERAAKLAAEAGDDRLVAKAWMNALDLQVMRLRKPLEAERLLPIVETALLRAGNTDELRAEALGTFADLDQQQSRLPIARARYEESVALHEKAFGEDAELARKLNRLAAISSTLGDEAAARKHLQRAADVLERNYGPTYRHLGVIWTTLGEVEYRSGNYAAGRKLLERALAHKERANDPASPVLIPTLISLGVVLYWQSEYAAADAILLRAETISAKTRGPEDGRTVEARQWRALVLLELGKFADAETIFTDLGRIARAQGFVTNLPSIELALARIHLHANKFADARLAISRARETITAGSYMEARALIVTAEVESAAKNPAAANRAREQALAILVATRGADHPEVAALRARIAIGG